MALPSLHHRGALALGHFSHPTYLVRRKIFTFFGKAFHVYDPNGQVAFYSKEAAFKLKDDIRLYTGEDLQTEVLFIRGRSVIDFSGTFDVYDSGSQTKLGSLRRKGLKSLLRDEWAILDEADQEVGRIQEDSLLLALVRRFLSNLIPQSYQAELGGAPVCVFKQHFNPFVFKLTVDFTPDASGRFDRRLGIAAALLLCAVEGRQEQEG